MTLTPGTRIGGYDIVAPIGAGGMGEVYRATDTRLKRQVALKVLPASVAADPDRLARFRREAEVLASLNHPHIAQIYGFEDAGATHALVMELVEGPTLADRIAQGALPLDEALAIARQIAGALEAAHQQGIVHRDLKPANIKVRPDGTVKVLDFGLAKLADASETAAGTIGPLSNSPTIMSPGMMTGVGMILGTAAYMSPEQARGRQVDKRADIWAFGVVLYEMLTGAALFPGDTVTDVLAAVVTKDPDLAGVPVMVRRLLDSCLQKDPGRRLKDMGDFDWLLEDARPPASTAARRPWIPWAVGALATAVAMAAWFRPAAIIGADPPMVRFQIARSTDVYNRTATSFAVSPDGLRVAYYGPGRDGPQTLIVRTLATGEGVMIPGSATGARQGLFWSADSRFLVQGSASGAQVFDMSAGTARPLCDCRFTGGSWNQDGVILLGTLGNGGIRRLSMDNRSPVAITTVDAARGEQDTWPVFLPDGRHYLFTRSIRGAGPGTYLGTLDEEAPKRVAEGSGRVFIPASGGRSPYVLGIDNTGLIVQPFDLNTLTVSGAATTAIAGAVAVSASASGVLAWSAAGSRPQTIPTWFDRKGTSLGTVGEAGLIEAIALSPDGRKLAVANSASSARPTDVWLRDLASGARTRLTFNGGSTPVWSSDGTRIAFSSSRAVGPSPFQRAADGTGEEVPLFPYDASAWTNDWSSDGRSVIFSTPSSGNIGNDLWVAPMEGGTGRKPVPYLVAPALQQQAQFSPDGRFVAYGSDQSGAFEIYVQPFPNASDGKWMISTGGGVEPRWSRDGKELFYFSGQTLMAVPVSVRPTFSSGASTALFDAPIQAEYTADSHRWQVSPDSKRFLVLANAGTNQAAPLEMIANWRALLKP